MKRHNSNGILIMMFIILILILLAIAVILGSLVFRFTHDSPKTIMSSVASDGYEDIIIRQSELAEQEIAASDAVNNVIPWTVTVTSGDTTVLGFIISEKGHVLTSEPVDKTNITVTLSTGETYKGSVVRTDRSRGLSVLRITASNLRSASFADSDSLVQGTRLYRFSLLDGEPAVFEGIISRLKETDGTTSEVYSDITDDGCGFLFFVNGQGEIIAAGNTGSESGYSVAYASDLVRSFAEG